MMIINRRHTVLILGLATVMAFCLIPSAASAAERTVNPGHNHVDVDIYKVPASEQEGQGNQGTETYPEKLDPREENWYKGKIRVRDQYNSSLCWSFSASKAAMISYAKDNRGERVEETSPIHLGDFFYNRVNDPLGGTEGDKNLDFGNWADWNWFYQGGSMVHTFQHMATWSGLVNEATAPFTPKKDPSTGEVVYGGPSSHPDYIAYNYNELVETESIFYAQGDQNDLKYVVSQHGAAVVSLFFGSDRIDLSHYINPINDPGGEYDGTMNLYNPDGYRKNNNHEVVVVGWDDNYPASNFSSYMHDSQGKKISDAKVSPKRDGAWLVMNSWGDDWGGDGGYFWVSYESEDILSDGICGFRMTKPDSYMLNFQYDGNAKNAYAEMSQGDVAANVFTNTHGGTIRLDAVGFTEFNDGPTNFDVKIYKDLTDPNEPTSGTLESSKEVTTYTPGYKTVQLDTPVSIDRDERYSVVITTKNPKTYFGIEVGEEGPDSRFEATTYKGNSFGFGLTGRWEDMEEYDLCYRIKGLANNQTDPQPTTTKPVVPRTTEPEPTTTKPTSTTTTTKPTKVPPKKRSNIKLKGTKITCIKRCKRSLTVKWKKSKQVVEGRRVTGYQIRYSPKCNMKKAKIVTVKGFTVTSKKIKKLKRKKTYCVQVRTIYIDKRGVKHYSRWSKKKCKKTR